MLKGIVYALVACFIWGMIFVIPQFMHQYNSVEIAIGRYWFYGAVSLFFLLKARLRGNCRYSVPVWMQAFVLSLLSGYYLWVVLAIRYTSPAICALILGISPITIAFYGNWKQKENHFKLLLIPSALILLGLVLINAPHITITHSLFEYTMGLISGLIALASWSLYVVFNSRYLKNHPQIVSSDWASMQGVMTLTWILAATLFTALFWQEDLDMQKYFPWNEQTITFYAGCAILGLFCSWVGGFLWNKASVYLPVSLAGQLMIFETIFGILFAYTLSGQMPPVLELSGIVLLLGAVLYAIRSLSQQPSHE